MTDTGLTEPDWHVKTRGYKVGAYLAGGAGGRYLLRVQYKTKQGARAKPVNSNHPRYGRTWPTREEAELPENKEEFRRWVESGLANAGGGGARSRDSSSLEALLDRGKAATAVAKELRFAEVTRLCVEAAGGRMVAPKPRGTLVSEGTGVVQSRPLALSLRRPLFTRTNHKVRAQKAKRQLAAREKAVQKAAGNVEWLRRQVAHLATVVAFRQPELLLPEDGDYSESQLNRAAQQAVVLHSYFYFREGDPPPFYKPGLAPSEYVGKAKGMKQVLWERGLWVEGMLVDIAEDDPKGRDQVTPTSACFTGPRPSRRRSVQQSPLFFICVPSPQSLSMRHVLVNREDFLNEVSALESLLLARGHRLIMSPKGHCELAGSGIEYDWGKMKMFFRRHNRLKRQEFNNLILSSMSREALPLETSRKFARKARAYRRAYREGVDNALTSIENMVKTFKTHRNAIDFAFKFIAES